MSLRDLFPQYLPVQNLSTKHKQPQRVEILVKGTVQGVGFRPFIYNLASRFEISGVVSNSGDGVVIEAQSQSERLELFLEAITQEAPALATINSVGVKELPALSDHRGFQIDISCSSGEATTAIPPDIAICKDCLNELNTSTDRRFNYPFTNCTNCGPRFTIVKSIPYDRPKTSMNVFEMCPACQKEYDDPANRRFHAQPNACHKCGPSLKLYDNQGSEINTDNHLVSTAELLSKEKILAIRGLGGYHLCVDGLSQNAVALLRSRKHRPDKPLAIMASNIETLQKYCSISELEKKLLTSHQHPIVLLNKLEDCDLADNLAPGIAEIGAMLPYTPLHHLLLNQPRCPEALVMTSGNISGSPICTSNNDALVRLGSIADYFLTHNREILTRVDDSVVKVNGEQQLILRRARGFVPAPVRIQWDLPKILGCGAGLKNTFSLARGKDIFPSQHIGELDNVESYDFYLESVDHLKSVYQLEPEAVACDLHPDYPSSRFAKELELPLYSVQHHHAHAAAVMAEHGLEEDVLAIVLDGTGLGDDGTIWGGEILQVNLTQFKRLGHLSYIGLPGGDIAASDPWRMGLSALYSTYGEKGLQDLKHCEQLGSIDIQSRETIGAMLAGGFNTPITSSCGRLFDGIASLLGLRQKISFEGQAAMELEALAKKAIRGNWYDQLHKQGSNLIVVPATDTDTISEISSPKFVKMVVDSLRKNEKRATIALRFHEMIIASFTQLAKHLSTKTGITKIVLSGGCMQNSLLLSGFFHLLQHSGLQVYTGNQLPINDGAISIGQTIIGGLRHVSRNPNESDSSSG